MTPEERLRALRNDERWESTTLAPRAAATNLSNVQAQRRAVAPVLITAIVAVLVIIVSVGAIQLSAARPNRLPAATSSPMQNGATALIRGTASTTTRDIAGASRPGGPDAAEVKRLQALATRIGLLTGQPNLSSSANDRLQSAVISVTAAFGTAVHSLGGTGRPGTVFFLVLNRAPTQQEQQLLRLLPYTVRLSWGPRISIKARDRQQSAAFASVRGQLAVFGSTDEQTDTQNFSFWPDRDHPQSAQEIAKQMATTVMRLTGAPPTFSIRVTDESKTAAGHAALHAVGHPLSDDGARLLIGARPTTPGIGVGTGGSYTLNTQRCVALGDAVIIAPPGSSISADGRTIHAQGLGTYPVGTSDTAKGDGAARTRGLSSRGGSYVDAKTAASYLPRGSTLCGATRFVLIGK